MPRRIVINKCYGGFSLSEPVKLLYKERTGKSLREYEAVRDDPELISAIEQIGLDNASGTFGKLAIIEIPDDVPEDGWDIQDYDGVEWVAEKHRTWG
jgi:hypothetical protein